MFLEVANRFQKRMKFGWETSFGPLLKVNPPVGIMEPGETVFEFYSGESYERVFQKSFEIQFNGGHLPNTDVMDADHSVKMWLTPAETRKRSLEVKGY